jgi:pimeloyl-ACP methyl ester carboxylesterase
VTYVERACPVDVEAALIGSVECGTLQVPESRSQGTGQVRLLVTTLTPPRVTSGDPLLVVGTDIATRPNYAGIAPLAQRTGRQIIFLEQRGTAHSEPSLACPGQTRATVGWAVPTGSLAWRAEAALQARRCYQHLTDLGVDVASYSVADMADDLADLIDVRGLAPVTVVSYGSTSLIAIELLRRHGDDVRAMVLDTPDLPGVDARIRTPMATASAITTVLRWCRADMTCASLYPRPANLLARALGTLADRPIRLRVQTPAGGAHVVLDPAMLVRVARQSMTDGGSAGIWGLPTAVPRLLDAVVRDDRARLRLALGELLGAQGPWCAGYRDKCMTAHVVDEGVWNTVLCRDIEPFTPLDRLPSPAPLAFRVAYDRAWWWEVCPHWPVPSADETEIEPLATDVPMLILVGGLAGPVSRSAVSRWTARMPNASIVVDPTGSHNVLGTPCMGELRDRWLADFRPPPLHPACAPTRLEW